MRYQISGKQINIGEALQTHVKDSLGAVMEKYAQRPTDATVIFSRSGAEYNCEATVHLSTGLTASAKAGAHEIYAAFEKTADKMEKQLRRYKRRLKDHHRDRTQPVDVFGAATYILASSDAGKTKTQSRKPFNQSSWPKWRRRSLRSRLVKP